MIMELRIYAHQEFIIGHEKSDCQGNRSFPI